MRSGVTSSTRRAHGSTSTSSWTGRRRTAGSAAARSDLRRGGRADRAGLYACDTSVGAGAKVIRTPAEARHRARRFGRPFAYLRPGAQLGRGAKVGTYVEVKGASIGPGSKVPHLTYVGDATIGADVNIGASSVFVNYDGVSKRHSVVGDHARTGADNSFVAPVDDRRRRVHRSRRGDPRGRASGRARGVGRCRSAPSRAGPTASAPELLPPKRLRGPRMQHRGCCIGRGCRTGCGVTGIQGTTTTLQHSATGVES